MPQHTESPGNALRSLRLMSGMTLKEVAYEADSSISYLSKVEHGKLAPSSDYTGKIASIVAHRLAHPRRRLGAVA